MEEIDRFQVPAVRAEMQLLVRGGWGCAVPKSRRLVRGLEGGGVRYCGGGGSAEVGPTRRDRYVMAVPSVSPLGPCPAAAAVSSRGARGHDCPPGFSVLLLSSPGISLGAVGGNGRSRLWGGQGQAGGSGSAPASVETSLLQTQRRSGAPWPGWRMGRVFPAVSADGLQRRGGECSRGVGRGGKTEEPVRRRTGSQSI